ncbi:hypothetical protein, partial [Mesorhizobium sp.]|uniref:hypothetical protein n=1 Tax=Mesorhizobium sp. TaxID=1871066 RepID=UPI0025C4844F
AVDLAPEVLHAVETTATLLQEMGHMVSKGDETSRTGFFSRRIFSQCAAGFLLPRLWIITAVGGDNKQPAELSITLL